MPMVFSFYTMACVSFLTFCANQCHALDSGDYRVVLLDQSGDPHPVARIQVQQDSYRLTMIHQGFTDHFLSMRPFKCLEGPDRLWCHVPYPYPIERRLGPDYTDLSYDLLFVWKPVGEYGINLWNGVYYRISATESGVQGDMWELDMNLLAVPPDPTEMRPIRESDLDLADPADHWLPRLRIEPIE